MVLRITSLATLGAAITQQANPIRKVVNVLTMMSEKVEAEGKRNKELFEKYECYCKTNDEEVSKAVDSATERIPQLQATVKESSSVKSQLQTELKDHKTDRAEGAAALEKAAKLREKEEAQYAQDSGDLKTNISALGKAVGALEKNLAGAAFLQTEVSAVQKIKTLVETNMSLSEDDRSTLSSFLATGAKGDSSEIVGILKTMKEEMEKDLSKVEEDEKDRRKAHEELVASKQREIASTTSTIENKTERVGVLAVKESEARDDLEETQKTQVSDQEFLVNLRESCEEQRKAFAQQQKTRAEEQTAIAETIKILNSDDALDLFKKTLPSPEVALIQMHATTKSLSKTALNLIKHLPNQGPELSLLAFSLKSKKVDFGKVTKMVDDLVVVLKKEQQNDDQHKDYCAAEFDKSDDKKKTTERDIAGLSSQKGETEGLIEAIETEVLALKAGIVNLDKSVADASAQRKAEHAEFVQTSSENQASLSLIEFAKNRLNKFYNPKLYKAPAPQQLSESDQVYQNFGGEIPTQAPGGISGTGITVLQRDAPPAAPTYKKGNSGGVTGMMEMLAQDLRTEMTEAEGEEKNAQAEYEKLMADSQAKRAADSEAVTNKEVAKANADENLQDTTESLGESQAALAAVNEAIHNLHGTCDFLVANFDTRKTARTQEIEGLQKAKATLAGASFSLVQTAQQAGFLAKAA